jgi:hypothetical protein
MTERKPPPGFVHVGGEWYIRNGGRLTIHMLTIDEAWAVFYEEHEAHLRSVLRELGCRIGMDDYVPETDSEYWSVDNICRHVEWLVDYGIAPFKAKLDRLRAERMEADDE